MRPQLKRFLTLKNSDVNYILREYIRMRKMFIENGIKDRQLERGEGMTHNMYMQRELIIYAIKKSRVMHVSLVLLKVVDLILMITLRNYLVELITKPLCNIKNSLHSSIKAFNSLERKHDEIVE